MTTTRRLNDSNKVIVTAALTGAVTTKQDNPYLPTQPKEIAEAALRCYEAGAAMVHIHVRDDNDAGSMRFDKFEEAVGLIRATGCAEDRGSPGRSVSVPSGSSDPRWRLLTRVR